MRKKASNFVLFVTGVGVLVVVFVLVALSSCYVVPDRGISNEKEEFSFSKQGYKSLDINGNWTVYVKYAEDYSADFKLKKGTGSDVKVYILGNVLKIDVRPGSRVDGVIYVTMPHLYGIDVSGAAMIKIKGFDEDKFSLDVAGAGEVSATECAFSRLNIDVSGAGELDFSSVDADDVFIDLSGAASVKVRANKSIKGDISGASSVVYYGNPSVVDLDTSGISSVKRK